MSARGLLGIIGTIGVVIGVAFALNPNLAARISIDRVFVYIPAGLAVLLALRALQHRFETELIYEEPESPEERRTLPIPGTDINAALGLHDISSRTPAAPGKQTLRDRLKPVAIEVIMEREDCSRDRAEDMLAEGTWTDDPHAAIYFAERLFDEQGRPIERWFSTVVLRDDPTPIKNARRAIAALSPDGEIGTVPADAIDRWLEESNPERRIEEEITDPSTNRWVGISSLSFVAGGVGVFVGQQVAFLLAVVGIAYAAAAGLAGPPQPTVSLDRTVENPRPDPGDEVSVTLTVRNEGEAVLPDIRVIDGVPEMLEVMDGVPRIATTLRPGEDDSVTYTVEAARGRHSFESTQLLLRDWLGATEEVIERRVETELVSVPTLEAVGPFPLRTQTIEYVGNLLTNTGGEGLAFHTTREYRQGDPITQIDWNRMAQTGDPATIEFQRERAAQVVISIDTRKSVYVADANNVSAVEYGVYAAGRIAAALLETETRVGLATLGPEWTWVPPSLGRQHRAELENALGFGEGLAPAPPEDSFRAVHDFDRVRRHLPQDAQVIYITPLIDNYAIFAARRLEARGHEVTVVSPDITDTSTPGGVVVNLERRNRVRKIRQEAIPVIDWDPDRALSVAIAEAQRARSR